MTERDAEETERTTIDEARRRAGAEGSEPAGPSPVTETGTTYLGVEEPIVLDDETERSTDDRSTNDTSA
jgi:hypothetical protein